MLDFKGREMKDWAGTVLIEDSGECYLVVSGHPDYRYDLLVREARRQDLADGQEPGGQSSTGRVGRVELPGKAGGFPGSWRWRKRARCYRGCCSRRWKRRASSGSRN